MAIKRFFNVYAPSGSQSCCYRALLFTRSLFPHLLQHHSLILPVLAGDWNCLVSAKDTSANLQEKYCKDLDNLLKSFRYSDAFRIQHPNTSEFTFYRASCAPSRLDRVYIPPHLLGSLMSTSHHPGLADHWGVHTELALEVERVQLPPRPPKSHWKLNSSILDDECFLPQFSSLFEQIQEKQGAFDDAADWWDLCAKPTIVTFCKSFSVSLARKRKTFKKFLYALIGVATRKNNWSLVTSFHNKLRGLWANSQISRKAECGRRECKYISPE